MKLFPTLLCKKTNCGNFSVITYNFRSKQKTVLIDDNVISFSIDRINHKIFFK